MAPWGAYVPILLSEVEQEQRPSGSGDRESIVVGAGLCDGEGERAYTGYATHIIRNVSASVFSLRRFGMFSCRNVRRHVFAETSVAMFLPKRPPPCFCRNVFCQNVRNPYPVYARSPSPSQRPAPTTIASRSPFPLGLCSCSTSLSKMGI